MSVLEMQRVLSKQADVLPDNEQATTVGVGDVYANPPDRKPRTLDARWGDAPPAPIVYSNAVDREAQNDRTEMLGRLFDTLDNARATERKLVDGQFATRSFESHSPLLQQKTAVDLRSNDTLMDRVVRVTGLR